MAKEAEPGSYRHSLVPNMSVKGDSVSVQRSVTSRNIQVLRGRTGNIVKVVSDRKAVFRDRIYGDITFTKDLFKVSMKKEGIDFRSYFHVGEIVYFDIKVAVGHVKCLSLWVSKKEKPKFSCSQPSSSTPQTKTEKKIPSLKGKLILVDSETAYLESTDCSGTVFFHRGNAFLFGVPLKGLRLDQIFRTGEELSFILSGDDTNVASCVWFGSFDAVNQSIEERMKCILKYCVDREICDSDRTTIVQELGQQRPPDGDKRDLEDELEETFGYCAAGAYSTLSAGSAVGRELNGSRENKTDANQAGRCDATEQTTLLSATASSNTVVISSVQNISSTTVAIKENGSSAVTQQHTTASKETSGILTASEPTNSNAIAAPKQSGSTSVSLGTTKQNVISAGEQVDSTILTSSTVDTVSANESHVTEALTSNVFMDSAIQSNISSEVSKITKTSMNTNSHVRTDSSKHNYNSASEPMLTDKEPNSTVAYVSERVDTLDLHKDCGYMDLHKVDSLPFISDMETETLCFSNCDTESEFYMSIINKDVERNLKASLIPVLKKEVGESASQILVPYAMAFLKQGIDCMMEELMVKVLSSVMCKETEQKNLTSDLQCGDADGLMITSMVQWKEQMLLVTNEWKAEKKKEMEAVQDRAQKLGQRISALCCSNTASTQSNTCGSSSNDSSVNYSNDGISCIAGDDNEETAEKSTLVGIVQDFMQLLNISDCQMVGTPKSVSEQGSQTVSTGCILYLKCHSDV